MTLPTGEPVTQCVCVVQVKTGAFLYISLFLHFFTVYNTQGFIRSYIDPLIFIEIKLTQFLEFIVEFELRDNHDVKMCVVFLFLGGVPFSVCAGLGVSGSRQQQHKFHNTQVIATSLDQNIATDFSQFFIPFSQDLLVFACQTLTLLFQCYNLELGVFLDLYYSYPSKAQVMSVHEQK